MRGGTIVGEHLPREFGSVDCGFMMDRHCEELNQAGDVFGGEDSGVGQSGEERR